MRSSIKRKALGNSLPRRKRAKFQHLNLDDLPWKSVSRPSISGDDGILELEEIEGVEVVYEDTGAGRVVKFNVLAENEMQEEEEEDVQKSFPDDILVEDVDTPFDSETLLPEWHKLGLHPKLLMSLKDKGFLVPTPIQTAALPFALKNRDVVGVAQTGSGKTLAYGLPILHYLLSQPRPSPSRKRPLQALILAPTRELALQVSSHLNSIMTSIEYNNTEATAGSSSGSKFPPHVSIAAVVGGMSAQKQKRLLDRGLDILIATPGRLWDVIQDDDELAQEIRGIHFLVLDEADRMIEAGHFAELENILRLTLRESQHDQVPEDGAEDGAEIWEKGQSNGGGTENTLQTFVFSATLSKELQRNLKKNSRRHKQDEKPPSTLDDLLYRLDFRDPNPEVIDLSPVGGVVSTLKEGRIECLTGDKDVHLYYFLLRHPGRSLVFLSSIDGIRRLIPLLELLSITVFPLHSQMEQRQRLKNLDRFKANQNTVLLATDIAARGLDIPAVDHVIHFQIPRTADIYVHRTGRTARAMQTGFSMLMIAPDERRLVKALLGSFHRNEDEIPQMSIDLGILDKLKARVRLARKIESAQHKVKKSNHDRKWMKETADVLGVELDSDSASDSDDQGVSKGKGRNRHHHHQQLAGMKAELREMISQPLIARGISTKYITSGSRPIVDDLLAGEFNDNIIGLKKAEAGSNLTKPQHRKKEAAVKKKASVKALET